MYYIRYHLRRCPHTWSSLSRFHVCFSAGKERLSVKSLIEISCFRDFCIRGREHCSIISKWKEMTMPIIHLAVRDLRAHYMLEVAKERGKYMRFGFCFA